MDKIWGRAGGQCTHLPQLSGAWQKQHTEEKKRYSTSSQNVFLQMIGGSYVVWYLTVSGLCYFVCIFSLLYVHVKFLPDLVGRNIAAIQLSGAVSFSVLATIFYIFRQNIRNTGTSFRATTQNQFPYILVNWIFQVLVLDCRSNICRHNPYL